MHLNFTCLLAGRHALFQDAFNLTYFRNPIHLALTASDTGVSVLREVQQIARVNAVHCQSDPVYRGLTVQELESNHSFPLYTFNWFLVR